MKRITRSRPYRGARFVASWILVLLIIVALWSS